MTNFLNTEPRMTRFERGASGPCAQLREDTRGALLVVGILLGAVLVGALFYLASVGDAIIWREEAQNAADAGAFSNAVWHARGMNMIVGINIVMSLVLSVFIVWRLIVILVGLITLITAVASVIDLGITAGLAAVETDALATMISQDFSTVAPTFKLILSGMNVTEIAVASSAPLIAANAAATSTNLGYHVATGTFSASMLPNANIASVTSILTCFTLPGGSAAAKPLREVGEEVLEKSFKNALDYKTQLGEAGKVYQESEVLSSLGVTGKMGLGFSLPVQTDRYSLLCKKAGQFWPHQLQAQIARASGGTSPKVFDMLGPLKGPVTSAFDLQSNIVDWFVKKIGDITGSAWGSIVLCVPIDTTATEALYAIWNVVRSVNGGAADADKADEPAGGTGLQNRAHNHQQNVRQGFISLITDAAKSWSQVWDFLKGAPSDDTQCGTPAAVWDAAANGHAYMRSIAVVAKATRMGTTNAGMEIADGIRTGNLVSAAGQPIWAHAEMYFDCSAGWYDCRSDAMWQLRWTARLRRVQPFVMSLAHAEANQPGDSNKNPVATGDWARHLDSLRGKLEVLAGKLGISPEQLDVFMRPFEAGTIGRTSTFSAMSGVGAQRLLGQGPGDSIRDFIIENSARNSEIH